MKCEICEEEIPKENIEECSRGRRKRIYFHCDKCGNKGNKKISLIPYKRGGNTASKGCSVPWGKSRRAKTNPMKKGRKRKK